MILAHFIANWTVLMFQRFYNIVNSTTIIWELKNYVQHLNRKLYYQQLHLKYLCNLARYWLQPPWGWHDRVETCSSVIICEIIGSSLYKIIKDEGTAVAQWLRCCATNRKVTGSIPDGVIAIFLWHNPSDRTMELGSTQALTKMSTRSNSWG